MLPPQVGLHSYLGVSCSHPNCSCAYSRPCCTVQPIWPPKNRREKRWYYPRAYRRVVWWPTSFERCPQTGGGSWYVDVHNAASLTTNTVHSASATTNASTAIVAVPPPSMLRGKTIEEIVNRWSTELETHVREFNRFAGEVSVWDRALIENGNNVRQ